MCSLTFVGRTILEILESKRNTCTSYHRNTCTCAESVSTSEKKKQCAKMYSSPLNLI